MKIVYALFSLSAKTCVAPDYSLSRSPKQVIINYRLFYRYQSIKQVAKSEKKSPRSVTNTINDNCKTNTCDVASYERRSKPSRRNQGSISNPEGSSNYESFKEN